MDISLLNDPALRPIFNRVDQMRQKYAPRDVRARNVRAIRTGDWEQVAPGIFSQEWPRATVANLIDTMSRDFAASGVGLPTITCTASSMLTQKAREFADKRSKITNGYIQNSNLAPQMHDLVDGYNCYGLAAAVVEPDFECKAPRIRILDGASVYPVWDNQMRTIAAAEIFQQDYLSLSMTYPEVASYRVHHPGGVTDGRVEVVKYVDDDIVLMYVPKMGNLVIEKAPNPLGKCYYVCVPRPGGEGVWTRSDIHGAYDDLIWPQMARNTLNMLAMEATDKAVRAPLAVPMDVADVPEGPDAIIRSANPQAIGRVRIDVPPQAWQSMQWLESDMFKGGMTTPSRSGEAGSGWTTGRGLEQLGDGFSTQLALAQEMLKFWFKQALCLCFDWDEKLWANVTKKIRGHDNGVPFELTYTPAKDIEGDHTVNVTYGYMTGQDPNRAIVAIAQGVGTGLISKETAVRNFPGVDNGPDELKKINIELLESAILNGFAGMASAIPSMAAQGADPATLIAQLVQVSDLMQKGAPITEAAAKVFPVQPPPPPAAPATPGAPDQSGMPPQDGGGGAPGGAPADGGRPSLQMLMAGLSAGGSPRLSANISRMPQAVQ